MAVSIKKKPDLDPAIIEIIRLIAEAAVRDYLAELKEQADESN